MIMESEHATPTHALESGVVPPRVSMMSPLRLCYAMRARCVRDAMSACSRSTLFRSVSLSMYLSSFRAAVVLLVLLAVRVRVLDAVRCDGSMIHTAFVPHTCLSRRPWTHLGAPDSHRPRAGARN
jgi:hypothetical protein